MSRKKVPIVIVRCLGVWFLLNGAMQLSDDFSGQTIESELLEEKDLPLSAEELQPQTLEGGGRMQAYARTETTIEVEHRIPFRPSSILSIIFSLILFLLAKPIVALCALQRQGKPGSP